MPNLEEAVYSNAWAGLSGVWRHAGGGCLVTGLDKTVLCRDVGGCLVPERTACCCDCL